MAIDFPNFDSFDTKVQMAYNDQIICRHIYPCALSSYTEKSATSIIKKEGFRIVAIWYYGMDIYELINNIAYKDEGFHNSELFSLLRNMTNELQMVVDQKKLSDQFMVIAKKL